MKKLLPFFSLALFAVACNSKPESAEVKTLQTAQQNTAMDTAGLAQFQQWKTQNELNSVTQTPPAQSLQEAPAKTVEVIREVRVVEKPVRVREKAVVQKETPAPATTPTETKTEGGSAKSETTASTGSGDANQPTTTGEKAEEKKGWSKSAKGAVIGGGAGAVLGAVINKKNRAAGAVIGGVLGGAVGYGIGKSKDKKDTSRNQ